VATLLYGLEARDPLSLVAAVAFLSVVSLLAAWFPAWRAARIDPARVLHDA
jgi:ABC-type lipoprotein release transport system permease subunit